MTAGIFQIFLNLDDYSKNPCDQAYFDIYVIYVIYVIYLNTFSGKKAMRTEGFIIHLRF